MSEHAMETRRRSRSKTPFLRSSCDHENCDHVGDEPHTHHKKKHSPTVRTIVEETVEVTSSSSVMGAEKNSPSKTTQTKIKTSDYSSEDSPENKAKAATAVKSVKSGGQQTQQRTESRTTTTVVTKTSKHGASSSVATSTPKMSNFVTSYASQFVSRGGGGTAGRGGGVSSQQAQQQRSVKEHTQNVINAEKENRSHLSGFLSNSFGEKSLSFDASGHIAYEDYKSAGEYWKVTPKTDYTYSKLSPHRRELAPGIVAMPNMSRKSLDNHHERINDLINRNPADEEYIRRRYESSRYTQQNRYAAEKLAYESGDEVDYSKYGKTSNYYNQQYYNNQLYQKESWLMRFITTIVTTVTSTWSAIIGSENNLQNGVGGGKYTAYSSSSIYQTKIGQQNRGFFGSIWHGITYALSTVVRSLYLLISSVLCLDTWLLQSSSAENKNKKRFLLLLLMLLPLLLLAAWWLLDEQERLLYVQRWHSLVPLSLVASIRGSLSTNAHWLKGLAQLPIFSLSGGGTSSQNLHKAKATLQKSMGPEEYENILNHINDYVHSLVDLKLQEQQQRHQAQASELSSKQIQLIMQIMKENLEVLSRQRRNHDVASASLSEADLNLIIQKVILHLQQSEGFELPLRLSPANMEEIKKLISLEINNHSHYETIVQHLDVDALMDKLLKSSFFTGYINEEISQHLTLQLHDKILELQQSKSASSTSADKDQLAFMQQQKLIIDNLSQEISFIKLSLNDKLSENEDLHYSIKHLQQAQNDLLQRLQELELSTDERFSALMQEISLKLNSLKDEQFQLLNQQVKLTLVDILGFRANAKDPHSKFDDMDLQHWVSNMFVAKEYLEQRLSEINNRTNDKIKQEIDRSGMFLMRDISEALKQEILITVENKHKESNAILKGQIKDALSEEEVKNIVKSVLAIYDADKTGLVDFALESAGGQILSTRCTESYQTKTAQISVFGIPLWYPTNTPRVAISPNVQPGECWAFQGFPGFLVLKLNSLVYVTGFTLEHIPRSLAPNGRIDSAPKNFTVWGLEHEKDQEPILFGEYEYVDNDASLQYFPLQNKNINRPYEIVELRIESNHGQPLYTCLYRFRVHGKPPAA